ADEAVHRDIADMADLARKITDEPDEEAPALLLEAPGAAELAWRDWTRPEPDAVHDAPGSFEALGIWEAIDDLKSPKVGLGPSGWMSVERTRALVAVDVNTGGDLSPAAGLKANIAALRALPRALRLRGYGGQITVDLAPFPKKDRKIIEQVLQSVLRNDPIETSFAGWTPLNNLELQRKRERPLLQDLLP
ncbi:MAG: ribonuclease E/G, partial [Pseudomonadota bacterium]